MQSGRLRWPVTIRHTVTEGGGEYGEQTRERVELIKTRADVRFDRGSRMEDNGEVFHAYDITFKVWLYIYGRISQYDIIEWQGRLYRIDSLEPELHAKTLFIKASLINE